MNLVRIKAEDNSVDVCKRYEIYVNFVQQQLMIAITDCFGITFMIFLYYHRRCFNYILYAQTFLKGQFLCQF